MARPGRTADTAHHSTGACRGGGRMTGWLCSVGHTCTEQLTVISTEL